MFLFLPPRWLLYRSTGATESLYIAATLAAASDRVVARAAGVREEVEQGQSNLFAGTVTGRYLIDASGQVVPLRGTDTLKIVFTQAQAHTADGTRSTIISQPGRPIGYPFMTDFAQAGDFEGILTYGIGVILTNVILLIWHADAFAIRRTMVSGCRRGLFSAYMRRDARTRRTAHDRRRDLNPCLVKNP